MGDLDPLLVPFGLIRVCRKSLLVGLGVSLLKKSIDWWWGEFRRLVPRNETQQLHSPLSLNYFLSMKILAGDGEGDNFRVNLSLSAKTPSKAILPLGSPENGFLEETRFLSFS